MNKSPAPPTRWRSTFAAIPWMLLLAVFWGAVLRLHQLSLQIPADDEWHALSAVAQLGWLALGADFGAADRSIPLTLFYKAVAETVGLDEWLFRLPALLAGVALLPCLWLLRPALQKRTLIGAAWLLSVSPLLIYFSRYARPYSISLLLALLAALGFYRWWSGQGRPWMLLYVFCAAASAYFHLSVIFFVAAPFGFALLESLLGNDKSRLRQLLGWAGLTAGCLAVLIGPPLLFHSKSLLGKISGDRINGGTVAGAWQLMAGSQSLWILILLGAACIVGSWILARNHPRAVRFALFLCLAQIAAVLATGLFALQVPIVLVRYCLVILPLLLLATARAAAWAEERFGPAFLPPGSLCAALALLLFWAGPLRSIDYHPNNWTNHALFNYTYDLLDRRYSYFFATQPRRISHFYQQLAGHPAQSLLLLEAPWHCEWNFNHYPHLQHLHRQRMMIGFVTPPGQPLQGSELPSQDDRFRFAHFAHLSEYEKIRQAGVDYVILHKDLSSEFAAPAPPIDISLWIARYRADFGPPAFEDDLVAVFQVGSRLAGGSGRQLPSR